MKKKILGCLIIFLITGFCSIPAYSENGDSKAKLKYEPTFQSGYQVELPLIVDIKDSEFSKVDVMIKDWNDVPKNMIFTAMLGSNTSPTLAFGDHVVDLVYQSNAREAIQTGGHYRC